MKHQPHIKTEGTSKFQIGEIRNNTIHYDFEKIKTYLKHYELLRKHKPI